ncbi:DUF5753 domain-containing protein [Actinomadura flavalba]|uniref:DUF5753 domain-containing protein n=1 Tax=Actinomadura flavalba TaxID=1120938 RepID=UPI0003761A14|nr:DUF5753 domain-containing protein [Actinomadura flavalba]
MDKWRQHAGFNGKTLAKLVYKSASWVSGVQLGTLRCKWEDACALDAATGANGEIMQAWKDFVDKSAYPPFYDDFPREERTAVQLRAYEWRLVSGLLQTDDYARVILGGDERRMEGRKRRQEILFRPDPPLFHVLLDSSVLTRMVGSPKIMADQTRALVKMSHMPRIFIHISPQEVYHHGAAGAFIIATQADRSEMMYAGSMGGGSTLVLAEHLSEAHEAWDILRSEAMNAAESRAFMEEKGRAWNS